LFFYKNPSLKLDKSNKYITFDFFPSHSKN
jgi:hypothetical protein